MLMNHHQPMRSRLDMPRLITAFCAALAAMIVCTYTPTASAVQLADEIYILRNHPNGFAPGPRYGLRLDELIDVSPHEDVFTFDFEDTRSHMRMNVSNNGTRIHIYGHAFGGYVVPNAVPANAVYDDILSGVFQIDFTYDAGVQLVPGDDDLWVPGAYNMANTGIISLNTETWTLADYSGNQGYTFRLGDENNDLGHWNTPGISSWGWLLIDQQPTNTIVAANLTDPRPGTRDWLFTAIPTPEPLTAALTTLAVGCLAMGMTRRRI